MGHLLSRELVRAVFTRNPKLAQEWDSALNFPLTPDQVLYCSGKKYWWRRGEFVWYDRVYIATTPFFQNVQSPDPVSEDRFSSRPRILPANLLPCSCCPVAF